MKLAFIALDRLSVSKSNMRRAKAPPDVSDILPTIRKRGVIQSLLVRPAPEEGHFQIDAGSRRFHAAGSTPPKRKSRPPTICCRAGSSKTATTPPRSKPR